MNDGWNANGSDAGGVERRDRWPALVIGSGGFAREAQRAVELAGGRALGTVEWEALADGLDLLAAAPVLVAEAERVDADLLAAALPRLDGHASALDLHIVVALDEAQIDLVASHLLGSRVQLLCAPSMADRVAALAVAAEFAGRTTLEDTWRESEAVRLQRLNEEVARIADVLARLTRDDGPSPQAEVEDRRRRYDAGGARAPGSDAPIDPADIRRQIRSRRLRDQFFGDGLFEDPAWDMLLDLYAAELEGTRVSVSSLCIASAVAPTTALRWIAKMSEAGLFIRHPDPLDRRRAFMALSPSASEAMRGYMLAARRGEIGLA